MAKTQDVRMQARQQQRGGTAVAESIPDLSAKVNKAIEAIKKDFVAFSKDFAAISMRREELAPKFQKAFGLWQAETGGTFVSFVRYLDPSVGQARNEYRTHRSYQAADYLRRIMGNVAKRNDAGQGNAEGNQQPTAVSPGEGLIRLLASFLKIIPEGQVDRLKEAMKAEFHWDDKRVERTMEQVDSVDPLVEIKGRTLENLKLSMPEHAEAEKVAA